MKEKRDCSNCEYEGKEVNERPCCNCVENDNWLPVGVVETCSYQTLRAVLDRAYNHAAQGKGAERHATGQDFSAQPMQTISALLGDNHGCLFQAIKKCQESVRLPKERAVDELLGRSTTSRGGNLFREFGGMKPPPKKKPHKDILHELEKRACPSRKVGYRSRKLALTVANTTLHFLDGLGKRGADHLSAYKCPVCKQYHLTSR